MSLHMTLALRVRLIVYETITIIWAFASMLHFISFDVKRRYGGTCKATASNQPCNNTGNYLLIEKYFYIL
jgi:hypothetical protein